MGKWRYYFLDLPLWGLGLRTSGQEKHLFKTLLADVDLIRKGFADLFRLLKRSPDARWFEEAVDKAVRVKIARESDAYLKLKRPWRHLDRHFTFDGLDNLRYAINLKRPVFLLTGHVGSFYTMFAATASALGKPVYTIARSVDNSPSNPVFRRIYERVNYRLTEREGLSRYIYTDYVKPMDRRIVEITKSCGIFFVLLDLPRNLYPHKRLPAKFLNFTSSFPAGFIEWGIKHHAVFLTAWNIFDFGDIKSCLRHIKIGTPLPDGLDAPAIIQEYANSLSDIVMKDPWQWMGLQIISQFYEGEIVRDVG